MQVAFRLFKQSVLDLKLDEMFNLTDVCKRLYACVGVGCASSHTSIDRDAGKVEARVRHEICGVDIPHTELSRPAELRLPLGWLAILRGPLKEC